MVLRTRGGKCISCHMDGWSHLSIEQGCISLCWRTCHNYHTLTCCSHCEHLDRAARHSPLRRAPCINTQASPCWWLSSRAGMNLARANLEKTQNLQSSQNAQISQKQVEKNKRIENSWEKSGLVWSGLVIKFLIVSNPVGYDVLKIYLNCPLCASSSPTLPSFSALRIKHQLIESYWPKEYYLLGRSVIHRPGPSAAPSAGS